MMYELIDENLLLYAGASLDELADELHESRAENGVLLITRDCHCAPTVWLRNHIGVVCFSRRIGVSRHRVVELGEEGEEHLERICTNCIFLEIT